MHERRAVRRNFIGNMLTVYKQHETFVLTLCVSTLVITVATLTVEAMT